jgi:DNA-binding MarR family transcriptional regulator
MTAGTPAPEAATVMGTPAPQAPDVLGTPAAEVPGTEPRPAADDAARVWRRMRELVLGRNERRREVCEALDLSFIRVKALLKLRAGPRTMRDLATELAIDRPYATVVIDELERRGLVARTVHPNDRRCRQVSLTAAGEDAARQADQILSDPPPALAALPPADLATLDRLTAALESW